MKLETITTKVLSTQHQLLSVEFTDEWLAHLREQAETKQGEDRSDLLAGECSYQPEWLDQKEWIEHLCKEYLKTFRPNLKDYQLDIFAKRVAEGIQNKNNIDLVTEDDWLRGVIHNGIFEDQDFIDKELEQFAVTSRAKYIKNNFQKPWMDRVGMTDFFKKKGLR